MIARAFLALILTFISAHTFAFDELKFAESLGLELVSEGHPYNFLGVNTMYANDNLTRQMLVISDVQAPLKEMRIIKSKDYFILEVPKTSNSYASMALVGISEEEIRTKIKTTSIWKKLWNELNPLPKAYAVEEECAVTGAPGTPGVEQLNTFYGSTFLKGALKCLSNTLQGVVGSTYGRFKDVVEGMQSLIEDPKAFWDKKVEGLKNVVTFISHFDTKIKEMAAGIANIPAETKVQMLCSFVGSMAGDAILAIMAGGAGLGALIFKVEEYVMKLVKLEKVFSFLNKAGKIKYIPPSFYEKLSTNRISQTMMDAMNTFARRDLADVLSGAMACVL